MALPPHRPYRGVPGADPAALFVENNKYLGKMRLVLPLPSGEFALLTDTRECVAIVPATTTLADVAALIPEHLARELRDKRMALQRELERQQADEELRSKSLLRTKIEL